MKQFHSALLSLALLLPLPASANLTVHPMRASVDAKKGAQIRVYSQSTQAQYVQATIRRIEDPAGPGEREADVDPDEAAIAITPGKFALAGGGNRLIRVIPLRPVLQETAYRLYFEGVRGPDDTTLENTGGNAHATVGVSLVWGALVNVLPEEGRVGMRVERNQLYNIGTLRLGITSIADCEGNRCTAHDVSRSLYPGGTLELPFTFQPDHTLQLRYRLTRDGYREHMQTLAAALDDAQAPALGNLVGQAPANGNMHIGAQNSGLMVEMANTDGTKRRIINDDADLGMPGDQAMAARQLHATSAMARRQDQMSATYSRQRSDQRTRIEGSSDGPEQRREDMDSFAAPLEGMMTSRAYRSQVDMGGARVTGVAAGDTSSAGSTDVVNGGQLFATNQRVDAVAAQGKFVAVGGGGDLAPAVSGAFGIAIGDSAEASIDNEGGIAIGSYSRALGVNSVVLGRGGFVHENGHSSFALGTGSAVYPRYGVALGAETLVGPDAENSVAVGNASYAREANTASFGNDGFRRRLVNVAPGTGTHDVTTVAQLNQSLATLGDDAGLDDKGNVIAPTYRLQGGNQNTVADALSVLDGAVTRTGSRVGTLESQLRSMFQPASSAHGDGPTRLILAGANGMVVSNMANGLIAPGSRDAVNGGQLHAVQQQLNGRMDGLEQRVDEQPSARPLAKTPGAEATVGTPAADDVAPVPAATGSPTQGAADGGSRVTGKIARGDEPPATPQVDTRQLEEMLARANHYTDGVINGLEKRLDRLDRRYNRMAAMNSAQGAMAMNTAGLQTMNRLGAGVGHAEGEAAMAVGYQRVLNPRGSATFSLHGAFTNSGERGVGLGVGVGW